MIMIITIGAPKRDVTAEMLISAGAKSCLAIISDNMQNTDPAINDAGISTIGFDVFKDSLIRKGTAMPIKDTGPAKAVTQAASKLDKSMMSTLTTLTFTPTLLA